MIATILIGFREGLEAALIVGIIFGYLRKTGQHEARRYAWIGVLSAVVLSLALAALIQAIGAKLEGRAEQIFEGTTMLVAVVLLTWMIFWMKAQSRTLKSSLEHELHDALGTGNRWGLALVAFTSVIREGIETGLLLSAATFASPDTNVILGALLGLMLAVVVGYLIYASTVRLNLRQFFNVTSMLLLLFAAGLLGRSVHEFQEAGIIPTIQEHLWNTSFLLSEESVIGQIFKTLFGYTSQPSLESVVAYVFYWVIAFGGLSWWFKQSGSRQNSVVHTAA